MNYRKLPRAALICAIYFGLNLAAEILGSHFTLGSSVGLRQTPGLTLALLVLFGPQYAPAVFAAQLFSSLFINHPLPAVWMEVCMPAVTTAAYTIAAWMVRRRLGPAPVPANSREAMVLAVAAAAAPLAGALMATELSGAGADEFFKLTLVRWIGGIGGVLTVVPVVAMHIAPWVLPNRRQTHIRARGRTKSEIAIQAVTLLFLLWLVFLSEPMRSHHAFYLCFVALAWISLRHGLAGTTLATLVINAGGYAALQLTGASPPVVVDFLMFQVAFAAVGLGLGTAVDRRGRAEAALAESQTRLEGVLAGARLGMWDCDMQTGRVVYDSAWAEMAGYRLEEIPTQPGWWKTQVHPDDRPRVHSLMQDHLAGRTPFYEAEFRFRMRDGGWRWIHARGAVTARDASGKALRHSGTQLDLTDRKQAEEDKHRLLEIIEASSDFIGSADLENRVIYANPAFLRMRGLPNLAAARKLKTTDFYPAWVAKKVAEEGRPIASERGSWTGDTALIDANGREIPVSQLIIAQRDDTGRVMNFSTIARDISKQREMEAGRLATERTMLQTQKLESLGVLAGGIAHDFNNLLTVMLGNVGLAQLDLPAGAPGSAYLQQIKTAALRATELCRQMLAYSGKGQFSSVLVDLSALVEDTTQLLQISITKKCVLKFDLGRSLPPVRVDATQIRQIVMNLVINASDAIGDRTGLIRVATRLMRADAAYLKGTSHDPDIKPGNYVALEVSDNGAGMTPEIVARVFEPFFTTKFAGRGLGLAAVLGIVRGHRGALKVASEPGRGSTFTLLLPAEAGAADAPAKPAPAGGEAARGDGTILVVDDEETVRIVAARLLESYGYATVLAVDGREAVRIFSERAGEFRAVLLDLTMPHMNGEETLRELRRLRSDVPVVLMSGYSEQDSVKRFSGSDRVSFVPKPFERETLIARIRLALEGAGAGAIPLPRASPNFP